MPTWNHTQGETPRHERPVFRFCTIYRLWYAFDVLWQDTGTEGRPEPPSAPAGPRKELVTSSYLYAVRPKKQALELSPAALFAAGVVARAVSVDVE